MKAVAGDDPRLAAAEWRANWTLVATAMVGVSLTSVHAASTGVMMAPIEAEFGWSRTAIYSGASLVSFVSVALATAIGVGIDRIGPRRVGIAAAVLLCSAVALMSTVGNSLWQWWALWLLVGLAVAAMPTVWLVPVASRFTAARGLAVAIALSGSGISTFFVPIIANALVEHYGWRRGYLGLGAIWAFIALPLVLLFFHGPQKPGKTSAPSSATPTPGAALPGLTARQGFTSPTYYKILFAAFCSTGGSVALVLNLVPVLTFTGLGRGTAATVAGLVGISTIIGRIIGGYLMDRMSARLIAVVTTLMTSVLPVTLLLLPGSVAAAAVGVIIFGLMAGAKIGAIVYLASRHLGARAFGTLYGTINALIALAVGVAPLAANYIYDVSRSYEPVMWAALPVLALAAVLYFSLGAYPDFAKRSPPAQPEAATSASR
jgi:MFS family permease